MKKIIYLLLFMSSIVFSQNDSLKKEKSLIYFEFSGGLSNRLGEVETSNSNNPLINNYYKNLKKGANLDFSLYFQLKKESNSYFGLKYNFFTQNSGINGLYIVAPNGDEGYGELSNKTTISFYGATYLYSTKKVDKDIFNAEIGLGYIGYKDKAVFLEEYLIKGGSIGLYSSLSYQLYLGSGIYTGPKLGFLLGSLKKVTINGPGSYYIDKDLGDKPESLSKIDFSLSIRIEL
ncbi:MAG: hypothetical protein ACI9FW_000651 [Flavobacterium sp.]|jgi:hypothetical protein